MNTWHIYTYMTYDYRRLQDTMDGRWTWRRKWKKVDRKAEARRALILTGSAEESLMEIEKEYCDEQLEKHLVTVAAFLENPNCRIFLITIAQMISQHMYDILLLMPQPPPRDFEKERLEAIEAQLQALEAAREARRLAKENAWQVS